MKKKWLNRSRFLVAIHLWDGTKKSETNASYEKFANSRGGITKAIILELSYSVVFCHSDPLSDIFPLFGKTIINNKVCYIQKKKHAALGKYFRA